MYFLLRNYQLYDFEFFIAKNNTEQPHRNRKVENPFIFQWNPCRSCKSTTQAAAKVCARVVPRTTKYSHHVPKRPGSTYGNPCAMAWRGKIPSEVSDGGACLYSRVRECTCSCACACACARVRACEWVPACVCACVCVCSYVCMHQHVCRRNWSTAQAREIR